MTNEQKNWLSEHPNYSPVHEYPVVNMFGWTDRGYLYPNGKFSPDDGKTFRGFGAVKALYVGRQYDVV